MRAPLLIVMAIAAPAFAGSDDIVSRPLVLAPGQIEAELVFERDVSNDVPIERTSIAPDLWLGVAPRWTVGVIHSDPSVDQIDGGASLCFGQGTLGCDRVYHGGGIDARYQALDWLAPRARLIVRDTGPWQPALAVGALARWQHGRFAVIGDPYLRLGLANRRDGNRTALFLPIEFAIQPTCRWVATIDTGWNSDLIVWQDGWHVPLAIGVLARASRHVDIGATFGFPEIYGPVETPKKRVVFVTLRVFGDPVPAL